MFYDSCLCWFQILWLLHCFFLLYFLAGTLLVVGSAFRQVPLVQAFLWICSTKPNSQSFAVTQGDQVEEELGCVSFPEQSQICAQPISIATHLFV